MYMPPTFCTMKSNVSVMKLVHFHAEIPCGFHVDFMWFSCGFHVVSRYIILHNYLISLFTQSYNGCLYVIEEVLLRGELL